MRISDGSSEGCSSDLERCPEVLAVTGPHQYEQVVGAVHEAAPMPPNAFLNLVPEGGLKLTPRHYSYLKISEGCNHRCSFCIIPSIRGDLVSRRPDAILREAEKLVAAGTKELLVISQDTSAYGVDLRHAEWPWKRSEEHTSELQSLMRISYAVFCLKKKKRNTANQIW